MAVSFVLIALCFQSCGTCRKATVTQTSAEIRVSADSLTREVRVLKTVTVPMSEAVLKIPTDSLRKLPEAAEYRAKSGQASAVVKHRGDTIIVYATCDSLQRQCERYERETALYRDRLEALSTFCSDYPYKQY